MTTIKYGLAFLITAFLILHLGVYLTFRHDSATVLLTDSTILTGSVKRTFWLQNLIVTNNGVSTEINKDDIKAVKWVENK